MIFYLSRNRIQEILGLNLTKRILFSINSDFYSIEIDLSEWLIFCLKDGFQFKPSRSTLGHWKYLKCWKNALRVRQGDYLPVKKTISILIGLNYTTWLTVIQGQYGNKSYHLSSIRFLTPKSIRFFSNFEFRLDSNFEIDLATFLERFLLELIQHNLHKWWLK